MSKDKRDDPYFRHRKPVPRTGGEMRSEKEYKRDKQREKELIEQELVEYYDDNSRRNA